MGEVSRLQEVKDAKQVALEVKAPEYLRFTPANHRLHLRVVRLSEAATLAGILLPTNLEKEKLAIYQVVQAGPGFYDAASKSRLPMSCKDGDYVLMNPSTLVSMDYTGQRILIGEDQDVLGIVELIQIPKDQLEAPVEAAEAAMSPADAREASKEGKLIRDIEGNDWLGGHRQRATATDVTREGTAGFGASVKAAPSLLWISRRTSGASHSSISGFRAPRTIAAGVRSRGLRGSTTAFRSTSRQASGYAGVAVAGCGVASRFFISSWRVWPIGGRSGMP